MDRNEVVAVDLNAWSTKTKARKGIMRSELNIQSVFEGLQEARFSRFQLGGVLGGPPPPVFIARDPITVCPFPSPQIFPIGSLTKALGPPGAGLGSE